MRERVLLFGPYRSLVGVVTEPDMGHEESDVPAILLLNAGLIHRVGPNRLHVRLARRLARHGFPVLRLDFSGLGDSLAGDSAAPFAERALHEAGEAMELLAHDMKIQSFVPIGICSGADVAFALATHDDRVVGAVSINGCFQDPEVAQALIHEANMRIESRYYRKQLSNPIRWVRLLSGKSKMKSIRRSIVRLLWKRERTEETPSGPHEAMKVLGDLDNRGVHLLAIFSEGSIAWDLANFAFGGAANKLANFENIQLEYVRRCDHVFTPLWSQEHLLLVVEQWACARFVQRRNTVVS